MMEIEEGELSGRFARLNLGDAVELFKPVILLDKSFSDENTYVDKQMINELTVNSLSQLSIQFKENQLILSSDTPFTLNRTRERLIINYEPRIGEPRCSSQCTFLKTMLESYPVHIDQEPIKKVYKNLYKDEEYMKCLTIPEVCERRSSPIMRSKIISFLHLLGIKKMILDQLIESGELRAEQRRFYIYELEGCWQGAFKPEETEVFENAVKVYFENEGRESREVLYKKMKYLEQWGELGEADMLGRLNNDIQAILAYKELNCVKRKEWTLSGSELHHLRFFNIRERVKQVDFYNRTFSERAISFGPQHTIKPYEHMVMTSGEPVKVRPIGFSYTRVF